MDPANDKKNNGEGNGTEGMIKKTVNSRGKTILIWDGTEWKSKSVEDETKAYLDEYKKTFRTAYQQQYLDTYGELFFIRYISELTIASHIYTEKVINNIEGMDGQGVDLLGENGNIEVKTIQNYLNRGNTGSEGTLPFEIFHRWTDPEKMYAGWLLSQYDYLGYNLVKREHKRKEGAQTPGTLAFILMTHKGKPFASVVFEDVRALLNRLYEICPDPEGWGIPDPDTLTPATDRAYWEQFEKWNDRTGAIIQNVWHVPFSAVKDLAIVQPIYSADPEEEVRGARYKPCTVDTARARLQEIQRRAEELGRGEHFDPEAYTARENEIIKRLEAQGAKVSKRIKIDTRIFEAKTNE